MKRKIKIGVIIIVLAVAIIAVATYLIGREQEEPPAVDECQTCRLDSNLVSEVANKEAKEKTPAPTQVTSSLKYVNTDYGFKIDLTEVWKDSIVEEEEAEGAIKKIVFYFKTADKRFEEFDYLAPALSIYIYDKQKWESMDPDTRSSTEIASNDKYCFSYSIWDSPPQDLEYITEKELVDVLETFELTK